MSGFILEVLAGRSWRREGTTYWTLTDAKRAAERVIRRGKGVQVRILPIDVGNTAVDSVTASTQGANDER